MTRGVLVVRPEPGNRRTADRLRRLGLDVAVAPLFEVRAIVWSAPDPAAFDALLVTSAAAVRLAGPAVAALAGLPVVAVGPATAAAARAAGWPVALHGDGGVRDVVDAARAAGHARLLHLAGRDRVAVDDVPAVTVYASEALTLRDLARLAAGRVVLLHSVRAAEAFGAALPLPDQRARTGIAALSAAIASAARDGWAVRAACAEPRDADLVALAHRLAIDPAPWPADKAA